MNINPKILFSRKSYFYPDMSKNFQITQYELPVSENGYLTFKHEGKEVRIRITRIHIEEDPGKLVHKGGNIMKSEYTLIDYNRSGSPLLEIVTEPDLKTPKQARQFLQVLRNILEHLDVLLPNTFFKVDCNVSIEGSERVEIKNVTGARNVEKALTFEIRRLKSMKNMKVKFPQHTRHYDEKRGVTQLLRTKEIADDYGYIFEPDLPCYTIEKQAIETIRKEMPELPYQRIVRFVNEYKIPLKQCETIILTDKYLADLFEDVAQQIKDYKALSNFVLVQLLKILNYNKKRLSQTGINKNQIVELFTKLSKKEISMRLVKELVKTQEFLNGESIEQIIIKHEYQKLDDETTIVKRIQKVLENNKKQVEEYKNGKTRVFNFLLGECLKALNYTVDVGIVRAELEKLLKS